MKTYDELLEETTFRTIHPGSGTYYLFIYWCHNEQHQSILTRRVEDILPLFMRKETDDHHEPKQLWFIEMVSPTPEYEMAWRRARLDRAIDSSDRMVRHMVDSYFGEGDTLPANVSRCDDEYSPEDPDDPDMTPDRDPKHYYCKVCRGTQVILGVDPVVIHQRVERDDRQPAKVWSRAMPPNPGRVIMRPSDHLFAFRCDGGHHQIGSMIQKIETQEDFVSYLYEPPLFLFHGVGVEIPHEITLYCKERDAARDEKARLAEEARKNRVDERETYTQSLVRYYLEGGEPPPPIVPRRSR